MIDNNYRIARQFNNEPVTYQDKCSYPESVSRLYSDVEWLADCNHGTYIQENDNTFYVHYMDHETLKGNQIKVWIEKIND